MSKRNYDFNKFDEFNDFVFNDDKIEEKKLFIPWVEKFRPKKIDDLISNEQITNTLKDYVKIKYLPHLLICGPSGTGKTSIINALANELYGNYAGMLTLQINASEERGIEIIRNKVKDFVMSKNIFLEANCVNFKLVILDEADAMTISAQGMLRRMIEDYTFNARFCLICNKLKNIDPAIQSRCVSFRFSPLNKKDIYNKIINICNQENLKYDKDGLELLIKIAHGDMRKVLNNLQLVNMGYKNININSVSKCLNYPIKEDIILIYDIIKRNKLNIALDKVTKIINEKQYLLIDIINELHEILINEFKNDKINKDKFSKIILNLKNVENNTLVSTSEKLLLSIFISSFY